MSINELAKKIETEKFVSCEIAAIRWYDELAKNTNAELLIEKEQVLEDVK